jgi:hypothetical protein
MEQIFLLSNLVVLPFWGIMIVAPRWAVGHRIMRSVLVFLPLTVLYSWLVLPMLPGLLPALARPELRVITTLLADPTGATVAWIHFLAFDLFVGRWQYHDALHHQLPSWLVRITLLCTFMAGPFGLLLYIVVRSRALRSWSW